MLSTREVLPFLWHEDEQVAELAAARFRGAPDATSDAAERLWEKIDQRGSVANSLLLVRVLQHLPQTPATIGRALDAIPLAPDEDLRAWLEQVLFKIDSDLLDRLHEQVLTRPTLSEDLRAHLRDRLRLRDLSFEPLWSELSSAASERRDREQNGGGEDDEVDFRRDDRIVQELARRFPREAGDRAHATLADPDADGWLQLACIDLIGYSGHRDSVDLLLQQYLTDGDMMWEAASGALARLVDGETVAKVESFYRANFADTRISVAGALSDMRHPAAEAALVRLLPDETHLTERTVLASGLAEMCTTDGVELLRDVVVQKSFDLSYAPIDEMFLALCTIVGREFPENDELRRRISDTAARKREIRSAHARMLHMSPAKYEELLAKLNEASALIERMQDHPAVPGKPDASHEVDVVLPIRRDAPKVGRNDRCPCGSGKKYKKCCMNRENEILQ